MKHSYQDLFTEIAVLKDRLDFVMKAFTVTRMEGEIIGHQKPVAYTLLDLYRLEKASTVLALAAVAKGLSKDAPLPSGSGQSDQGLPTAEAPKD